MVLVPRRPANVFPALLFHVIAESDSRLLCRWWWGGALAAPSLASASCLIIFEKDQEPGTCRKGCYLRPMGDEWSMVPGVKTHRVSSQISDIKLSSSPVLSFRGILSNFPKNQLSARTRSTGNKIRQASDITFLQVSLIAISSEM